MLLGKLSPLRTVHSIACLMIIAIFDQTVVAKRLSSGQESDDWEIAESDYQIVFFFCFRIMRGALREGICGDMLSVNATTQNAYVDTIKHHAFEVCCVARVRSMCCHRRCKVSVRSTLHAVDCKDRELRQRHLRKPVQKSA